jgi:hypothetical protein
MKTLDELFKRLWEDYAVINKQADEIRNLISSRGEQVINDHIAFRTFNIPKVGIDVLAETFVNFGYKPKDEYTFTEKKLFAKHYEHIKPNRPKIFISELRVEEFSQELQEILKNLVAQIPDMLTKKWDFCVSGVPWKPVSWDTYCKLKDESEYAAWMAAFGFRANHFTVDFNSLKSFKDLEAFNSFIKKNGYNMNSSGGEIKGSPKEFLEQSSTLAHPVEIQFADCRKTIPGCYYEFARRYQLPDGKFFQGFVVKSADKIFESTDNK